MPGSEIQEKQQPWGLRSPSMEKEGRSAVVAVDVVVGMVVALAGLLLAL